MSLVQYLSQLNSAETQWGIWVNPEDVNDYRIGQYVFENGGMRDEWIHIGSLEQLSFGFQSESEALDEILSSHKGNSRSEYTEFSFNGRIVRCHRESMKEAYYEGNLASAMQEYLKQEIESCQQIWAENEAEDFVHNKLPEILEAARQEAFA